MFTGIITDIGEVRKIGPGPDPRFEFTTAYDTSHIAIGDSICCSGVCLTAIKTGTDWFAVTISGETLSRTTLGEWRLGTPVNLERSLRVGDELGGHIVYGHVDGVGSLVDASHESESRRLTFEGPEGLERHVATKGSITVDGVSLTINEVTGRRFSVNVIPHTLAKTTLGRISLKTSVNLEIDVIARYVARLQDVNG